MARIDDINFSVDDITVSLKTMTHTNEAYDTGASGTGYSKYEFRNPTYDSSTTAATFSVNMVTLETLQSLLTECLVCGGEAFILCEICVESIKQARKDLYTGMLLDMMEMEGKDDMKLHQGFTNTGSLVHAAVLIQRGKYEPRALCGVRVMETSARYFDKADDQCQRCKGSAAKSA